MWNVKLIVCNLNVMECYLLKNFFFFNPMTKGLQISFQWKPTIKMTELWYHFEVTGNLEEAINIHTPTEYSILSTDNHRLHLWVTECSLHRVNNALPHCCTV